MSTEEQSQLLVIIFDVNPIWWGLKALQGRAQITKCLDCLLVFVNSYLMMHHENKVAIIASHTSRSKFLYPSEDEASKEDANSSEENAKKSDARHQHFATINDVLVDQFKLLMANELSEKDIRSDSLIAGSMTIALCYIHRLEREKKMGGTQKSRILVIKAADDAASQYMSFMNVIFAAQKQHVIIDSCIIGHNSGLLQQACDMTGGLYLSIPSQELLLQYLLTAFLIDSDVRKEKLSFASCTERNTGVDYRAACFCHRSLVDIGFVCSVCLSIFCQFSPICTTCEAAFKPPPSGHKQRRKKKLIPTVGLNSSFGT